jgi:hypothetical protein
MQRSLARNSFTIAVLAALAGCAQSAAGAANLAGAFVEVGGPAPGHTIPIAGQVVARSHGGKVFTVTVGPGGHFQLTVPPGTYRLTGYSSTCLGRAGPITVRAGKQVAHVQVVCPIP